MKRFSLFVLAAALLTPLAASAQTQQPASVAAGGAAPSVVNRSGAPVDVDQIIRKFAAREAEFRKALNEYSFKRDAVLQTVAMGGQISGEYHRVSRFVFDDSGNRFEKILFFPLPTIQLGVTNEDLEDLGGVQAFALEDRKLHEYDFSYVGKEKIDELDLYVFDVSPKILKDARRLKELKKSKKVERFFEGRIWVDDRDFQIVKARGKGVPEIDDQRFPTFETYREMIDGKYWFPTYTIADDELVFKNGNSVRLRMRVKFEEFERLRGKARVIEEGEPGVVDKKDEQPEAKPTPTPAPSKPKP